MNNDCSLANVVDGHVHTRWCGHARGTMVEYVEAALARGLGGLVFLEHLEAGVDYFERTWLTEEDFQAYRREGEVLRRRYQGRLTVGIGVEVGYNPQAVATINAFLARHPWDRVGLSCHFMAVGGRSCNLVSRKEANWRLADEIGLERAVAWYYETLMEGMAKVPAAQVVCHLDAVLRFHPRIDTVDQRPFLERALAEMARRGLALEVNTSGYPVRGEPFPAAWVCHRARQLGIPLVPGSDAHRPEDVGRRFQDLGLAAGGANGWWLGLRRGQRVNGG